MQNEEGPFRFVLHSAFIILTFLLSGCSSTAVVTIKPVQSPEALSIAFSRAYYHSEQSAQDQIILEKSPIDESEDTGPGGVLPVVTSPPLWQVLLIQLHWRSSNAGRVDSPVADNAVLHWYVYGKPDDHGTALLHYVGTGKVSVSPDGSGAGVYIHNAELHLTDHHGNLRDPLVDFIIHTHFHAMTNPQQYDQVMQDLQKAIGEAGEAPTATTQAR
jgi:hypothetical protein